MLFVYDLQFILTFLLLIATGRACVVGDLGAIERLLKSGAKVYILDNEGKLAVERAGKVIIVANVS